MLRYFQVYSKLMPVVLAALFTIIQRRVQSKCPSINKMWYHTYHGKVFSHEKVTHLEPDILTKAFQSHSSLTLAKECSKFSKPGFSCRWTENFQMLKLDLEKAEEPEIKLPTSTGSSKKQESSRKTSTSALLTTPKSLTVDRKKLWEILQEMGIPDHLTCLLRNLYACQEPTVRTGHGATDWF